MIVLIVAGVLFAGYGTAYLASDDVRYLTRAGLETIRILEHRRAIRDLIRDPAIDPDTRSLLALVLDARDFASTLGYDARETYTTYAEVGRDTLLLVLSAAPRNCLCPHFWRYPIVGRIPYKGFFDPAAAEREAARFEARGYDVYLRPAGAFASLGWWNDPLYSTAMSRDSVELVATVLHEIAHNTLYVKSATPFNESFAQFAGYRGAEAFFRARGDPASARRAEARWLDEVVLSEYYRELARRLDSLYRTAADSAAVEAGRMELGRWAREQLEGPVGARLRTYQVGHLADRPVNNARLVAAQIYRTRLDLFEGWYERHGRDIARAVRELKSVVEGSEGDEAFRRLEQILAGSPGAGAPGRQAGPCRSGREGGFPRQFGASACPLARRGPGANLAPSLPGRLPGATMARDLLPLVRDALRGKYAVVREIGRGGAARVFAAQDAGGRLVALKVLHPPLAASVAAERFLREIRIVEALDHPRIARLLDSGEAEWVLYYAMEYVEGPTLKQHVARVRRASIGDALHVAHDVLDALAYAHERGIVHRDVKPENVILAPAGATLVDFGIAKAVLEAGQDRLTRSGFAVGTSAYMSPEQISGIADVDARSDLYSLGCVLYEALTGHPPYDDPFEDLILTKHRTAEIPDPRVQRPETPGPLAEAVIRALAKAPEDRWSSARAMQAALPALTRA